MSFQIELDRFDEAYGHFLHDIRDAIQRTFEEEVKTRGLTQQDIADVLGVDRSVVSKRLSGGGNVTLKTVCDLYTAMGRLPLSNYRVSHEDDAFSLGADVPRYAVGLSNISPLFNLLLGFDRPVTAMGAYQSVNQISLEADVPDQQFRVCLNQDHSIQRSWFLNRPINQPLTLAHDYE